MGQRSSQHDKCEVGSMHTYRLDLVHFPSSFTHSFSSPWYLHVTVIVPIPIPVPVLVHGYIRSLIEEAGCQAHGILKRWVVRPVRNYLGERIVEN